MVGADNNVVVVFDAKYPSPNKLRSREHFQKRLTALKRAISVNNNPGFATYIKFPLRPHNSGSDLKVMLLKESGRKFNALIQKMHEDQNQVRTRSSVMIEFRNGLKFNVGKNLV